MSLSPLPSETAIQYFDRVFENNLWGAPQSRSGPGSEGTYADDKILTLKFLLKKFNIAKVVDIGCGDMFWMKECLIHVTDYTGVDVSKSVIDANIAKVYPSHVRFNHTSDIDIRSIKADAIIAFDVFGHMLHSEILETLNAILQSDVKYVIVTDRLNAQMDESKTRLQGTNLKLYWNVPCIASIPSAQAGDAYTVYRIK